MSKDIVQIEYRFLDLVVEGCYTEAEQSNREYQGCPADFEIEKIYSLNDSKEQDLYDLFEAAKWLKDLESTVINVIVK